VPGSFTQAPDRSPVCNLGKWNITQTHHSEHPGPTISPMNDEALIQWLMANCNENEPSLEALLRRPWWHQRAACRGVGHKAFMARRHERYDGRELCGRCPVRRECLEFALADTELVGMWGGTTELDRRRMRRGWAVA
jgi:WhiB family transcriptional regulator, redox-sensing transcriptional regulator